MVSLPPVTRGPENADKQRKPQENEAVRYMLAAWAIMIGGELVHQLLVVASVVIDPSALRESAKDQAKGEELSDAMINAGIYGSIVVMALIQLLIIGLFVVALKALQKQKKWAPNARRLLQIFSVFFALRMLTLFAMTPASTAVPMVLYGLDGVVQIILGVAGICGIVYSADKASVAWAEAPLKGRKPDEPVDSADSADSADSEEKE